MGICIGAASVGHFLSLTDYRHPPIASPNIGKLFNEHKLLVVFSVRTYLKTTMFVFAVKSNFL